MNKLFTGKEVQFSQKIWLLKPFQRTQHDSDVAASPAVEWVICIEEKTNPLASRVAAHHWLRRNISNLLNKTKHLRLTKQRLSEDILPERFGLSLSQAFNSLYWCHPSPKLLLYHNSHSYIDRVSSLRLPALLFFSFLSAFASLSVMNTHSDYRALSLCLLLFTFSCANIPGPSRSSPLVSCRVSPQEKVGAVTWWSVRQKTHRYLPEPVCDVMKSRRAGEESVWR